MTRFFVSAAELDQSPIVLTGENAAHARVLRLKSGEKVVICDGQGRECTCSVAALDGETVTVSPECIRDSETEAAVKVSLYIAFPKADKLEHVIQKATELGVYEIVAFPSARCVSRPDEKSLRKKLDRWQKIAAAAAEQSGRGRIPEVIVLSSFQAAVKRACHTELPILFYENEHATTLRMALESKAYSTISILSGPEGGLEPSEVAQAKDAGIQICTLGRRILRCETAPLCGLSAIMYASGEF